MKHFFSTLLFVALLSGCAGVLQPIDNPITPERFAIVQAAYGVALAGAVGYRTACAEKKIPPSCRAIVQAAQPYQLKAQNAIVAARLFIKNHDTINTTTAITIAIGAMNAFRAVAPSLGAK